MKNSAILSSKYLLYFFLFMSLIQIIFFMKTKDYVSFIIFLMTSVLVLLFSKNMIVIMALSLSVTNIVKYGIRGVRVSEGFDGSDEIDDYAELDVSNVDKAKPKADAKHKADAKPTEKAKPTGKPKSVSKQPSESGDGGSKPTPKISEASLTLLKELKSELPDFKELQKDIIDKMDKINPLLTEAKKYIKKYETFTESVKTK